MPFGRREGGEHVTGLRWTLTEAPDFTLAAFEVVDPGGVLIPSTIRDVALPPAVIVRRDRGLVLSGRGPVWLYAYLTHLAHTYKWLGIGDPRLGGAVIVARHAPDAPELGSVLPIPLG